MNTVPPSSPPEAWEPLLRAARLAARPLERFLRIEAASGIVLVAVAAVALAWANSAWAASYVALWHTPVGIRFGSFAFERTLEWVVNDGLMVVFFFVVGLEIRREIDHGELSQWRRAALPVAAALGGMLAPAGLYLVFGSAPAARPGWGVPMATDIAFALGVLALLGKRVPPALRVLLLALAVIDDLGAIVVIAVFYSEGVSVAGLGVAASGLAGILALQRLGVRAKVVYVLPGLVVWGGIYAAGIHPTIAGVVVGLVTPVRAWLGAEGFLRDVRSHIDALGRRGGSASGHDLAAALRAVNLARREAMSPAESLIEMLHPWVAYLIMPLFALANAGVPVGGFALDGAAGSVVAGIVVGLVVGKPVGILAATGVCVRLRVAVLPAGLGARSMIVLGAVAGIGFTMALFVAQLAFSDPHLLAAAKVGVLGGSVVAALGGLTVGRLLLRPEMAAAAAPSADEAESSTVS